MSNGTVKSSKRVLEPNERISEVLFGLVTVLTLSGSPSVAEYRPWVTGLAMVALGG